MRFYVHRDMEARLVIWIAVLLLLPGSCRKHTAGVGRNYTTGNPATEGSLLVKKVDAWTNGAIDSTIYVYDAARKLIAEHETGIRTFPDDIDILFYRDDQERITKWATVENEDSGITAVYYVDATSGKVAYTVLTGVNAGGSLFDSAVYTYNQQNYPVRISEFISSSQPYPSDYDSFTYDAAGNLSQYLIYDSSAINQYHLNIAYQFQYDNKINPLFSYDDARLVFEWSTAFSPNNLVKQTNIYGNPPQRPSDDVTLTWYYRSDKKPDSSAEGGTAISITGAPVVYSTYYYQ
jgi:hypothetical protein